MVGRARGRIKVVLGTVALSLGALAATPALADDVGAGVLLHGFGASSKIQGLSLDVGENTFEPEPQPPAPVDALHRSRPSPGVPDPWR